MMNNGHSAGMLPGGRLTEILSRPADKHKPYVQLSSCSNRHGELGNALPAWTVVFRCSTSCLHICNHQSFLLTLLFGRHVRLSRRCAFTIAQP